MAQRQPAHSAAAGDPQPDRASRLLKFEKPHPERLRTCRLSVSTTRIATIAALLLDERRRSKSLKIEFQQPARDRRSRRRRRGLVAIDGAHGRDDKARRLLQGAECAALPDR